jgi:hypothetical protein
MYITKGHDISEILKNQKTIAVVGLSPKKERTSHWVAEYLQNQGYRIIPVYPREEVILNEKVYRSLKEIPEKVDTVLIFRRSEFVPPIVEEAIQIQPSYIWMQDGIYHEESAKEAEKHGIVVVMNDCMYREHKMHAHEL